MEFGNLDLDFFGFGIPCLVWSLVFSVWNFGVLDIEFVVLGMVFGLRILRLLIFGV